MKENTLQDIVDQLETTIQDLSCFIESEELDVEDLTQRLDKIRDEIIRTIQ
jgi:hypothetical protein